MRLNRLFTTEALRPDAVVTLDPQASHYLSRVLRKSKDDGIILFNGDGNEYRCTLESLTREGARARVLGCQPGIADSPLKITLCQAISRGDRMDYSLQKATELGVHAVRLLLTERVEVKLDGKRLEKRLAHWNGVIRSASEQCGRASLPELHGPIALHQWLQGDARRVVLDHRAETPVSGIKPAHRIEIAIGPEGGFSDSELELIGCSGVAAVSLGPRVLRTETAGPAAIAVLQATGGDL